MPLYFNHTIYPNFLSLSNLNQSEFIRLIDFYQRLIAKMEVRDLYKNILVDFVNQLNSWKIQNETLFAYSKSEFMSFYQLLLSTTGQNLVTDFIVEIHVENYFNNDFVRAQVLCNEFSHFIRSKPDFLQEVRQSLLQFNLFLIEKGIAKFEQNVYDIFGYLSNAPQSGDLFLTMLVKNDLISLCINPEDDFVESMESFAKALD